MPRKYTRSAGTNPGRPCKVCESDHRAMIDLALAAGKTARFASQSYGVSVYAIQRHRRAHLKPAMAAVAARREDLTADALLNKLQDWLADAESLMSSAKDDKDRAGYARLLKECRETLVRLGQASKGLWQPERSQTFIDARRQTMNFANLTTDELKSLAALNAPAIIEGELC